MKNIFCCIVLILSAVTFLSAQLDGFAPVGAKWTYREYIPSPNPAVGAYYPYYMQVDSEVVFQNRLCRHLSGGAGLPQSQDWQFYLYNQNDSVFWYGFDNKFSLLYDFSAEVGDSWKIHGFNLLEGDTVYVTVDSISHIVAGGDTLKVWHITFSEWADWSDILIERIGSTRFIIPFPALYESRISHLRCFESDTFQAIFVPYPCDTLIAVGTSAIAENAKDPVARLYPNPASDQVQIECPAHTGEMLGVEMFDITGRKVLSETFYNTGTHTLYFPNLPGGWYRVDLTGPGIRGSYRLSVIGYRAG